MWGVACLDMFYLVIWEQIAVICTLASLSVRNYLGVKGLSILSCVHVVLIGIVWSDILALARFCRGTTHLGFLSYLTFTHGYLFLGFIYHRKAFQATMCSAVFTERREWSHGLRSEILLFTRSIDFDEVLVNAIRLLAIKILVSLHADRYIRFELLRHCEGYRWTFTLPDWVS